ncbi:MAG: type II toxin-antitoxin system VapC family toxin [Desulfamplus sp.]|nr:type II toxin-antitoxin system VapC family toxin [Desulfamplus sp.]
MKKYLLDTNIVSYLKDPYSEYYEVVGRNFLKLANDAEVCVSILTLFEVEFGLSLSSTAEVRNFMQETIYLIDTHFTVLPTTRQGAKLFGNLKVRYVKKYGMKTNIAKRDDIDLILASTAITENAVIVSNDGVFKKLQAINPDLKHENWTLDGVTENL